MLFKQVTIGHAKTHDEINANDGDGMWGLELCSATALRPGNAVSHSVAESVIIRV